MVPVREQFVWVERYRPQTLDECILPETLRASLQGVLQQKQDIPHMLFSGRAGVGKTTVARALARELEADALVINASEENGIDVLRTKIKSFASSLSLDGKRKFVILDEADYLHPQSTQPALRAFMEEFAATCFVLTCNFPQRIIPPLHSRCASFDFKIPSKEKGVIAQKFALRAMDILTKEGVQFDKRIVANVVAMYFPDFRRVLNELQRFSAGGELSDGILAQLTDKDVDALFTAVKSKDFGNVRKWVALHDDMDAAAFYRMLTEQVPKLVDASCLPELIVQMADYSYRSGFCAD